MENTLLDRTFKDDSGNIVIAQPPNLPLLVALGATALKFIVPPGNLALVVDAVAFGAWFTWSWLELFDGVNYFRRGLGLVVLLSIIVLQIQ